MTRALILAAGVGRRMGPRAETGPKILLRIGGQSLLERHLRLLILVGVTEVVLGVGFEAQRVEAELARLPLKGAMWVTTVHNADYRRGSVVTIWSLRDALAAGGDVFVMDGDVLYDRRLLKRLVETRHRNCFLLDRDVEPGEEPMKLAMKDGHPVDFRKTLERPHDFYGESVGFFRLDEKAARDLATAAKALIDRGRSDDYFEEALRDVLLASPPERFGVEDVTGLPWIEIDFPGDIERAEREILPALLPEDR
ncbi:MAG: phosphocholine cytidylyltransferase family protein [Alphaproteobacteria bacterium]|nr:phosphocholine cytidylyltransferase family protein [Alphaproteobacteria bacterium]